MKTSSSHIAFLIVPLWCSLMMCLPCRAQHTNLKRWSLADQARREQLSHITLDFNYIFRSRVVNDSTFSSIRDCHIINRTQGTATVSDAYGDFKITANVNDSITFSAMGYEKLTIAIVDSMYNYGYVVKLKPATYALEEVTIRPFFEIPKITKWEVYTKPLPNQGGINIPTYVSPITFFYNLWSKEGKQKRHYNKVITGTADFMLLGEKFNGEMVSQITGLKDDELINFMSYCDFSSDFLMNYSPETIKREIRKKYREYTEILEKE